MPGPYIDPGQQNFVDQVGPVAKAAWLNWVDQQSRAAGVGLSNPVTILQGGTNASNAPQALANLGGITPAAVTAQVAPQITAAIVAAAAAATAATNVPTAAEKALSITPANYAYLAYPYVDPQRYGADPTGVADSTLAVQTAINVAGYSNGIVFIGPNCNYLTGPLTWQAAGNNAGLWIMGCGEGGSILTFKGTSGAHLTFQGSAAALAASQPTSVHLKCTGFQMNGGNYANSTTAVNLQGIAQWDMDIFPVEYGMGYSLQSALLGKIAGITENNNIGILARRLGTNAYSNFVKVTGRVIGNITYGLDIGQGSGWDIDCDLESNGTSGNASTGGIIVRSTTSAETGVAKMTIRGWLENNHGWTLNCESNAGLNLVVKPEGVMFGDGVAGAGLINVPSGLKGIFEGCESSAQATDIVTVAFDTISVRQCTFIKFTDTSNNKCYDGAYLNGNAPIYNFP